MNLKNTFLNTVFFVSKHMKLKGILLLLLLLLLIIIIIIIKVSKNIKSVRMKFEEMCLNSVLKESVNECMIPSDDAGNSIHLLKWIK